MPDTTDNAKLIEDLRRGGCTDRCLCDEAATALASANALNERLVAFIRGVATGHQKASACCPSPALRDEARAILANLGEKETGR